VVLLRQEFHVAVECNDKYANKNDNDCDCATVILGYHFCSVSLEEVECCANTRECNEQETPA